MTKPVRPAETIAAEAGWQAPWGRMQARLPDAGIRRLAGILVMLIGARYLWSGQS